MLSHVLRGGTAAAKLQTSGEVRDMNTSTSQPASNCWINVIQSESSDDQQACSSRLEELELKFREMLEQDASAAPATVSEKLTMVMGGVILANTLYTAIELDYATKADDTFSEERFPWFISESIFATIYIIEIVIRVYLERFNWVYSGWNWLDLILIAFAVLDTWLMPLLQTNSPGLQSLALLRIVRLIRLTRLLKLLRHCKKLYKIVIAYLSALQEMIWVLILLVFGLFMSSLLVTSFIGLSGDFDDVQIAGRTAYEQFGTVPRSMYSLFEMMTLEGWDQVGRPIVTRKPVFFLFFFGFIMFFTFGLLNMIIAIVVEKSMNQVKQSEDETQAQEHYKLVKLCAQLCRLFRESDSDGNGVLTKSEFQTSLNNSEFRKVLREIRLNPADMNAIFDILDEDGSGTIKIEEIIESSLKVQGVLPSNWDMIEIRSRVKYLAKQFANVSALPGKPSDLCTSGESLLQNHKPLNHSGFSMSDQNGQKLNASQPVEDKTQAELEAMCAKFELMSTKLESHSADHNKFLQSLDSSQAAQQTILEKLDAMSVKFESISARLESQSATQVTILQRLDSLGICERC